ncbi:hypothetical protein B0H15DRAFT_853161 [Mycena belliarum]|uniref:Uncharacterized protein n=1 Tax=Mycena belliarum TaxID=1033014 RepID=A0AAD6TWN2_9AGAR|nr:hypothetical protein B0H15DRAFT_853161 [Mycena belliae]
MQWTTVTLLCLILHHSWASVAMPGTMFRAIETPPMPPWHPPPNTTSIPTLVPPSSESPLEADVWNEAIFDVAGILLSMLFTAATIIGFVHLTRKYLFPPEYDPAELELEQECLLAGSDPRRSGDREEERAPPPPYRLPPPYQDSPSPQIEPQFGQP